MNRREAIAAGAAALFLGVPEIARAQPLTTRTVRVPIGSSPEDVQYDVLGDIQGGTKGRMVVVLFDALLGTGAKFRHSKVREALGNDFVSIAIRNPLAHKESAMDRALMSKAVIDADPDCGPSQDVLPLGVSGGALDALTASSKAVFGERAKMCVLLSAQGDLAVKKYANLVGRKELRELEAVYNTSGIVAGPIHKIAMRRIRAMAENSQTVFEKFIEKLSSSDKALIANDPELRALLFTEFEYYCDQTPSSEDDVTLGMLRIRNGVRSLFRRGVPWDSISKDTPVFLYQYDEDTYVHPSNSKLIAADLKSHGHDRTEVIMLPGDKHFGYFEKDGPLLNIVKEGKKRIHR